MRFIILVIGLGFLQSLKHHWQLPFFESGATPIFLIIYAILLDIIEILQNRKG